MSKSRLALTVSFVADGVRRQGPRKEEIGSVEDIDNASPTLGTLVAMDDEDRSSYENWLKDIAPGAVVDHPFLPVVWDENNTDQAQRR